MPWVGDKYQKEYDYSTARVLMEFTPEGLDLDELRAHLVEVDHVIEVHDLHASTVATGLPVLTAHVVVADSCFHDGHAQGILAEVRACVAEHFEVAHTTFQLEGPDAHGEDEACAVSAER